MHKKVNLRNYAAKRQKRHRLKKVLANIARIMHYTEEVIGRIQ
jgi:hypothetical protein